MEKKVENIKNVLASVEPSRLRGGSGGRIVHRGGDGFILGRLGLGQITLDKKIKLKTLAH